MLEHSVDHFQGIAVNFYSIIFKKKYCNEFLKDLNAI